MGGKMNNQIVCDPDIMLGKPVIAGARVTVEQILDKLANGETWDDLIAAHPQLTRESISAALKFAADALRVDMIYPFKNQDD